MGWKKRMQQELMRLQMQQIRDANAPNPYLEQLKGLNKGIIDWHTNPNNTVKDIYKHPTLGGKLPIFQMAKGLRDQGRIGRGIAGLGDKMNPQYAKELQIEDSSNRNLAAAGMLEMGLQNELGQAQQNLEGLIMSDTQRRTSANGLTGQLYSQLQQQISNSWGSFFTGILKGGISGLANIGMGALTGGFSTIGQVAASTTGGTHAPSAPAPGPTTGPTGGVGGWPY